jgi:hypothetical protein
MTGGLSSSTQLHTVSYFISLRTDQLYSNACGCGMGSQGTNLSAELLASGYGDPSHVTKVRSCLLIFAVSFREWQQDGSKKPLLQGDILSPPARLMSASVLATTWCTVPALLSLEDSGQWTDRSSNWRRSLLENGSRRMAWWVHYIKGRLFGSGFEFRGVHGGDYEEFLLMGYKNPVRTSQETHCISATESNRLILCRISGFHGCVYEECRLLGYKNPDLTSQETHYNSATESNRLILCRISGFRGCDYEECRLLGCYAVWML